MTVNCVVVNEIKSDYQVYQIASIIIQQQPLPD